MSEVAFPVIGAAFVLWVVLPCCAAIAKVALRLLEREGEGGALHRLNARYVLLVGSSLLPLAWFFSAALHQAESGQSVLACLLDHDAAELCLEPAFFALLLSAGGLLSALQRFRNGERAAFSPASKHPQLRARIERVVAARPELAVLRGRVGVTEARSFALGTFGWFEPRVLIGEAFAGGLSDEMLASALGHEAEHVTSLDPLRYAVLRLALAVNPVGRWLLDPHAARWLAAREAHCDREAVVRGSAPLPMADAIVRAARPIAEVSAPALGTGDMAALKLRIGLLLAFAEQPPARCCARTAPAFPAAVGLFVLSLLLPHQTGTAALDAVHFGAERALSFLWP
ncbi:MAG TPA: hypothetical protein VIM73_11460 [Polyangiaceae bacterium]